MTHRLRHAILASSAAAAAFALALPLLAGSQARVTGHVTDGKGVALEGVKVLITTPAITNFKLEFTTDKDGKWATILNDSTIRYHYRFEKQGYMTREEDKKVAIGTTEQYDVKLLNQEQAREQGLVKEVVDPFTAAYNGAVDKYQAGDLDGALTAVEEAIKLDPAKANGYDLGAKIALKKKDWDKTIQFGEKAMSMDEDNTAMIGIVLEAARAKGDKVKAAEYEKKFNAANPDQPEVVYNKAVELFNKGDFKSAEPLLKKAVEAKPDFASAHFLLGMCSVNLNKIPEMKKHLNEYLKLDPKGKDAGTAKEMLDAFK